MKTIVRHCVSTRLSLKHVRFFRYKFDKSDRRLRCSKGNAADSRCVRSSLLLTLVEFRRLRWRQYGSGSSGSSRCCRCPGDKAALFHIYVVNLSFTHLASRKHWRQVSTMTSLRVIYVSQTSQSRL